MATPEPKPVRTSMRKAWFEYVRKTRAKMSRAQKTQVSHRNAMQEASKTWAEEKVKLERRNKREARKALKAKKNEG